MTASSLQGRATYAGDAPAAAVQQITVTLSTTLEQANDLTNRVLDIVNSLLGPEPTDESKTAAPRPSAVGRLRDVEYAAYTTRDALARAHRALDRLNIAV